MLGKRQFTTYQDFTVFISGVRSVTSKLLLPFSYLDYDWSIHLRGEIRYPVQAEHRKGIFCMVVHRVLDHVVVNHRWMCDCVP